MNSIRIKIFVICLALAFVLPTGIALGQDLADAEILVSHEIADAGFDPQGRTSHELLDFAESRVFKIAEQRASKSEGPENLHTILEKTVDKIEKLYQQPHDGVTGVSTGFVDLDKMTAGLQPSDLIIVVSIYCANG